ncbi:hypothetical protein [Aneurinibacillus uraniidurans]|uniref:hypothetical protein n=1 Tax=Aneurinibacillus uraniidurans TaxID=2966586 RepID=UPI00234A0A18|nr:hypothetical protein [Aneurinibacillus sp. B1]WCN37211.1 hypothetical protein PO771_15380 [Aneurinibacillus sp. B1]
MNPTITQFRTLSLTNLNEVVKELAELNLSQGLNLKIEENEKGERFLIVPEQNAEGERNEGKLEQVVGQP